MLFPRLYGFLQLAKLCVLTVVIGFETWRGVVGVEVLGVVAFAWVFTAFAWVFTDPFGIVAAWVCRAELRWRLWPAMWRELEKR